MDILEKALNLEEGELDEQYPQYCINLEKEIEFYKTKMKVDEFFQNKHFLKVITTEQCDLNIIFCDYYHGIKQRIKNLDIKKCQVITKDKDFINIHWELSEENNDCQKLIICLDHINLDYITRLLEQISRDKIICWFYCHNEDKKNLILKNIEYNRKEFISKELIINL
jgi:hypothetical protein